MTKPQHPSTDGEPDTSGPFDPSAPVESPITVVGIGASAGGLAALKTFFEHVPPDGGLAYVVVVHLSPDHESHLAELLQPHGRMPVLQVTEAMPLAPNQVYVIPPGRNLSAVDTHLRLGPLEVERRERAPIDHFFRTLAATHDGSSIGVILTGTGSDGTLGVKEIKAKNGLVVVQDPAEAEYDGMPQSAVATGIVDLVLPLAEIPGAILRFAHTEPRVEVPADGEETEPDERQLLQKIFARIRARTGRDFTHYKRSTLLRRIGRRMQLRHVEELSAYATLLREEPDELAALADDLLITVTNFFRDPEVFTALATEVVPKLFDGKGAGDDLRVWSVGCATGEEAYSLAILLLEEADRREVSPRLQLFASDLHEHSLERAREGFYAGDIETDVSAERLERFFVREDGGYRIGKEVRELVVFAPHNLLSDPPFSRLDLVACRNVLIYLQRSVQHEIVDLFHYALRSDGYLVLGTSEAVDGTELFRVVDKKRCVYRKRNVPVPEPRLPVFPLTRLWHAGQPVRQERTHDLLAPGPLHQRLVERYAPPSLLVSPDDNVVHLSANVGRYLVHPGGEPTMNVYRLVRDELRFELRSLLHAAREGGPARRSKPIVAQFDGERVPVVMHVRLAPDAQEEGYALVIFDEREPVLADSAEHAPPESAAERARSRELEAELTLTRHRLQSTVEEFETSQEELRASNEEFQSANEELRSTLEELETSKEELQSINEELQTVNQENRHRVEELRQITGDLQNLLVATDIATLFLDRELRILRFTPRVGDLFNVRSADRGRPLSDLTHRLGYPTLQQDARRVLETLVPVVTEVGEQDGVSDDDRRWYLARLLPYRSPEERIDGVVITFIDITAQRRAVDAVRASDERQAFLLALSDALRPLADPYAVQEAACRVLGERLEATRVNYAEVDGEEYVVAREYRAGPLSTMIGRYPIASFRPVERAAFERGRTVVITDILAAAPGLPLSADEATAYGALGVRAFVSVPLVKDGRLVAVLSAIRSRPGTWTPAEIALVEGTAERTWAAVERARAEAALRESEAEYRTLFDSIDEGFCIIEVLFDGAGRPVDYQFVQANPAFERQTGLTHSVGRRVREFVPDLDAHWFEFYGRVARTGESQRFDAPATALGRYYDVYAFRVGEPDEHHVAVLFNDITERKRLEVEAQAAHETIEHQVAERTAELADANVRLAAEISERARAQGERNDLLRRLATAEEGERRRLARELHDQLGQELTAFRLGLDAAVRLAAPHVAADAPLMDRLAQLAALAGQMTAGARYVALELRPPELDDVGLESALGTYLREWAARYGVAADLAVTGIVDEGAVPAEAASALYRITQEALTNVAKHAEATQVSVIVKWADDARTPGSSPAEIALIVEDDGRGFDVDATTARANAERRLGLAGMRERAALVGGTVAVESHPGSGTTLYVRLPVASEAAPHLASEGTAGA